MLPPPTLVRYLNRLLLVNFVLTGVVLGSIFLAKYFLNYLIKASTGELGADLVLSMALLVFVSSAQYLLPLSLFFALAVTFSRLREGHESTALIAAGLGPGRVWALCWPTVGAVVLALAAAVFWVMPWAEGAQQRLLAQAGEDPAARWLRPGAFTALPGGGVVYAAGVREVAGQRVYESLFLRREVAGEVEVVVAPRASLETVAGRLRLRLEEGAVYRHLGGADGVVVYRFASGVWDTAVRLETAAGAVRPRAKPVQALWGSSQREDRAEWHWRWAVVVMAVLTAWSTQLLIRPPARRRDPWPMLVLVLLYAFYFNALTVGVSWYRKGLLEEAWVVHGAHLLPLLVVGGWRWLERRRYGASG